MKTTHVLLAAAAVPFLAAAFLPSPAPNLAKTSLARGRLLAPCPDPTLDVETWARLEAQLPDEDCLYAIEPAGGTLIIIRDLFRVPHLDIKPGSCPNPINVSSGGNDAPDGSSGDAAACLARVPMSVLGNGFDVTQIDVTTITLTRFESVLAGSGIARPVQANFADTGTPFFGTGCECHALNGDGSLDLDLKFERVEIVEELDLANEPDGTEIRLRIAGRIAAGIGFRITDCMRIINHGN